MFIISYGSHIDFYQNINSHFFRFCHKYFTGGGGEDLI